MKARPCRQDKVFACTGSACESVIGGPCGVGWAPHYLAGIWYGQLGVGGWSFLRFRWASMLTWLVKQVDVDVTMPLPSSSISLPAIKVKVKISPSAASSMRNSTTAEVSYRILKIPFINSRIASPSSPILQSPEMGQEQFSFRACLGKT
jgi:hypothetical protein